jgi:multicomponent Na+:H+ antiporter subunit D
MISQGAADAPMATVWFLLVAASAGVFLHAGVKFPWFVFFQKDSGLRPADPPWNMRAAMVLFALLCVLLGVFPQWLYALLPYPVDYQPYTAEHLVSQFQLLLFAGLAFFVMLPLMKRTNTLSLDFDWFYRRALPRVWRGTTEVGSGVLAALRSIAAPLLRRAVALLLQPHGPEGLLARTWPIGSMLLWVAVMLLVLLTVGALGLTT